MGSDRHLVQSVAFEKAGKDSIGRLIGGVSQWDGLTVVQDVALFRKVL